MCGGKALRCLIRVGGEDVEAGPEPGPKRLCTLLAGLLLCPHCTTQALGGRRFRLLRERDDLLEKLSSHDNLNVAWPWDMGGPSYDADYLQHRDIETNTRDIRVLCCELENAAKKMEEKKGYLLRLESINAHVREFYRENPERVRPTNPRDFTEHQYHSYWMAETSDGQIERMEKNISIRRGLWGKGDRILYDSLNLILTQGDIRDLLYQCEINGIKIPAKLQQRPTTQIETRQFRRELVKLVQSF